MANHPWYENGLKFSCTRCGRCCRGAPGIVWVTREEVADIARFLNLEEAEVWVKFLRRVAFSGERRRLALKELANGDCVFFEQGCEIYPVRPRQCRTYPFWRINLHKKAAWLRLVEECPGAGMGRLHTAAEIEKILEESPL
ncbi:MAG: hypothetical protein AMS15_02180 [Planctomycetes bacterium DG_23]|nr:MAG: hypothetical protein AMS15_02180 [Planctomycetes bacterium DG_23]